MSGSLSRDADKNTSRRTQNQQSGQAVSVAEVSHVQGRIPRSSTTHVPLLRPVAITLSERHAARIDADSSLSCPVARATPDSSQSPHVQVSPSPLGSIPLARVPDSSQGSPLAVPIQFRSYGQDVPVYSSSGLLGKLVFFMYFLISYILLTT